MNGRKVKQLRQQFKTFIRVGDATRRFDSEPRGAVWENGVQLKKDEFRLYKKKFKNENRLPR